MFIAIFANFYEKNLFEMKHLMQKKVNERLKKIEEESYLLSLKRGFKPGKDLDDWLVAEKKVDGQMFNQNLTPNERHGLLMAKFFSSIDLNETPSKEISLAYLDFMYTNYTLLKGRSKLDHSDSSIDFRNISILTKETKLSFLTKRSVLVGDSTIMSHEADPKNLVVYKAYNDFSDYTYNVYEDISHYTNCPDLIELGEWLKSCKELLELGDVFYYPKIMIEKVRQDQMHGEHSFTTIHEDLLYDAIVSSRKIIQPGNRYKNNNQLIRAIVQIELPVIDNTSLSDFSKISCDEHISLERFRTFFREQFIELLINEGNESFDKNLHKISFQILNGVSHLKRDFSIFKGKSAIQSIGAVIGTTTATLIAINSALFKDLQLILGAGGGVALFTKIIEGFYENNKEIKNSPFYYMWLIERENKK